MGFLNRLANAFRASAGPYTTAGGLGQKTRRLVVGEYGPNAALDYSAENLRTQSRDLVRKNTTAYAGVERIVSNIVGTGIKPRFGNDDVQALWNRWVEQASADGMLDFYGLQTQVAHSVVVSGEVFARHRARLPIEGLVVPYQVEVLEADFVPFSKNEEEGEKIGRIRQGVEFDKNLKSKRVAYHLYKAHPNDGNGTDGTTSRVPASEVMQIYLPSRPGQIRGEPWLARLIARLRDLDQYDSAELTRKKVAAMFVGFIRRPLTTDATIDDLSEIWGDAEENEGVGDVTMTPGTMQILKPGEEVDFSKPPDVGGQYDIFIRAQKREIAAALGLLYEQLTGDFSQVNDRTWRAAVNEFRRRCEVWQYQLMVFQFCRPVVTRWLQTAQLNRLLPAGFDITAPVLWTPQAWPHIHPLQDVQAKEKEVRAGFTSRARVVSERGEDVEEIDREQADDNQRADENKVRYDSDGRFSATGGGAFDDSNNTGGNNAGNNPGK